MQQARAITGHPQFIPGLTPEPEQRRPLSAYPVCSSTAYTGRRWGLWLLSPLPPRPIWRLGLVSDEEAWSFRQCPIFKSEAKECGKNGIRHGSQAGAGLRYPIPSLLSPSLPFPPSPPSRRRAIKHTSTTPVEAQRWTVPMATCPPFYSQLLPGPSTRSLPLSLPVSDI